MRERVDLEDGYYLIFKQAVAGNKSKSFLKSAKALTGTHTDVYNGYVAYNVLGITLYGADTYSNFTYNTNGSATATRCDMICWGMCGYNYQGKATSCYNSDTTAVARGSAKFYYLVKDVSWLASDLVLTTTCDKYGIISISYYDAL